jgi:hypothetical protein
MRPARTVSGRASAGSGSCGERAIVIMPSWTTRDILENVRDPHRDPARHIGELKRQRQHREDSVPR